MITEFQKVGLDTREIGLLWFAVGTAYEKAEDLTLEDVDRLAKLYLKLTGTEVTEIYRRRVPS